MVVEGEGWRAERRTTDLHRRRVDVKLPENSKSLLEQLVADGDVSNVRGVVVVQAVDVLHHAGSVSFDRRQDEQILQVSERHVPALTSGASPSTLRVPESEDAAPILTCAR